MLNFQNFRHQEAASGYYFHINSNKYCYVTEYQGETLIHLRIFGEDEKTGQLIPTKTGGCLRVPEWEVLRKVGPEVLSQMDSHGDIMRRPLGMYCISVCN